MNLNQTIEAARNVLRFKHMAVKTEKSYVHWIRRFAFWCKDPRPHISAASASRRLTRPASTLPPPLTHLRSSAGTSPH